MKDKNLVDEIEKQDVNGVTWRRWSALYIAMFFLISAASYIGSYYHALYGEGKIYADWASKIGFPFVIYYSFQLNGSEFRNHGHLLEGFVYNTLIHAAVALVFCWVIRLVLRK